MNSKEVKEVISIVDDVLGYLADLYSINWRTNSNDEADEIVKVLKKSAGKLSSVLIFFHGDELKKCRDDMLTMADDVSSLDYYRQERARKYLERVWRKLMYLRDEFLPKLLV